MIKSSQLPFIRSRTYVSTEDFQSRYKLEQTIGKGYFSKVKLAYRILGDRKIPYAVKIISKSVLDPTLHSDFLNEISILKQLDHPNCIKLQEVYDNDKFYYLVMDHCSGGSISDYVKKTSLKGREKEELILKLMRQIIKALKYCHKIGIIHRDLKPDNILFASPSDDALIKVIDFGLSRKFSQNELVTSFLGTPYFVAPEVIQQEYAEECDIWSLGATAYMLFTGETPFDGKTKTDLLKNIKNQKLRFKADIWSEYSEEAKDLVKNLLRKKPSKRLTPIGALNHEAFRFLESNKGRHSAIDPEHLRNLISAKKCNNFQKLYCHLALKTFPSDLMAELVKTFHGINTSHQGFVSLDELKEAFNIAKIEISDTQIKELMDDVDLDKNGKMGFSEFVIAASGLFNQENDEIVKKVFENLDEENAGEIDYTKIKKALLREGRKVDDTLELRNIVGEVSEEEKIDFEKFKLFVMNNKENP